MTFLPIVDRELRVAARKGRTFWSRLVAAAAAIVIAACVLILAEMQKGAFGTQLGPILFAIFKWLSFAFACSAGVFLTSDCLSEEKRDGTLGLLFLTDLRGYDVVFGKLLATSLQAAYGLLAAFPVIGLSFLLGGVTGGEFWRVMLTLFNTLFFSLAAGVFVSSISRDAQKAMSGAMLLGGLFILVFPALDWWMSGWNSAATVPRFSLFSPTFAFGETGAVRLGNFWFGTALVHATAWMFFAAASFLAARSWQEKAAVSASPAKSRAERFRFGSQEKRLTLRRRLLPENPIRWLAVRDQWLGHSLRLLLVVAIGLFVVIAVSAGSLQVLMFTSGAIAGVVGFIIQIAAASQASRFFLEGKRAGTLELLLVTPLFVEQIVRGHWWALRRIFLFPVVGFLLCLMAAEAVQIAFYVETMGMTAAPGSAIGDEFVTQTVISGVVSLVTFVTGMIAVAWFGMWMGLTSRKTNAAVIKTSVFVQVLPWLALVFLQMMLLFGIAATPIGGRSMPVWAPHVITGILGIGIDIFFITLSRRKLFGTFRDLVAHDEGSASAPQPPPLPVADLSAPPVIAP